MSDSAPEPGPMNQSEPQQAYSHSQAPEPFVPKKRFQMGRLTKVLLGVLLVAVGFFGGVGVTKLMDAGQTRPGRGQFQNLNGGRGRNRQNGAPTHGVSPSATPAAPTAAAP